MHRLIGAILCSQYDKYVSIDNVWAFLNIGKRTKMTFDKIMISIRIIAVQLTSAASPMTLDLFRAKVHHAISALYGLSTKQFNCLFSVWS